MQIGVPSETKVQEDRVAATPDGVPDLAAGRITHPAVAGAFGLDYTPVEDVLAGVAHV